MRLAALVLAFVLCGCAAARAADPTTQPASQPAEKFFTTEGIGEEIMNEKLPVAITAAQAAQLFSKDAALRLAADWDKHLPAAKPARGAHDLSMYHFTRDELLPAQDTEPVAYVANFSALHVVIRITRPMGRYLWHIYDDNLATLRVERTPFIDKIFNLAQLTDMYAASFKGIQQGDTEAHMREVLGQPDAMRSTEAMFFYTLEYQKDAVDIEILDGKVFKVWSVPPGVMRSRQTTKVNAAGMPVP